MRRTVPLLAALAAFDAAVAFAQPAPVMPAVVTPSAAASAAAAPVTDVPALRAALYDPAARPDQREQAAQRLIARPDPTARTVLREALQETRQPAVPLAAARALAAMPTPDPLLAKPLFDLLDAATGPEPLLDAAGRALSNYKTDPQVLTHLIVLADSPDERVRLVAMRAVGTFVEKRAAGTLVALIDPAQSAKVNATASAGLVYLTGLDASTDAAGWQAWWAANRNKSDDQFQADLVRQRAMRYDQARARVNELSDVLSRLLRQQYQRAGRDQRPDLLLGFLKEPEPSVRIFGCTLAMEAAQNDVTPPAVKEQLRLLIGDANADVRRSSAGILALINDADAVVPILTQLGQETDSSVRAALADALRPIRDPKAAPALLTLLDDLSAETAQKAADALMELGSALRDASPADADAAAQKIVVVLQERTSNLKNVELRYALVQAAGQMRSRNVAGALQALLYKPGEDGRVRRALLAALGRYKDANFADTIADSLNVKNDPTTLIVALKALGDSADNFSAYEKRLTELIDPNSDPQPPEVRDAAWKVLTQLFPKATLGQLRNWEGRVAKDPAKLVVVLSEERNRAIAEGNAGKAAEKNQQIGDACLSMGNWKDAETAYTGALVYARANNVAAVQSISENLTIATLRNRQYQAGVDFVQQQIRHDPQFQSSLGPIIGKEVGRLIDVEKDIDAANQLIDLALKIDNPQLSPRLRDDLESRQAQVKNRDNQHNQTPFSPGDQIQTAMAR